MRRSSAVPFDLARGVKFLVVLRDHPFHIVALPIRTGRQPFRDALEHGLARLLIPPLRPRLAVTHPATAADLLDLAVRHDLANDRAVLKLGNGIDTPHRTALVVVT